MSLVPDEEAGAHCCGTVRCKHSLRRLRAVRPRYRMSCISIKQKVRRAQAQGQPETSALHTFSGVECVHSASYAQTSKHYMQVLVC